MSHKDFRALLESAGLDQGQAAEKLGVTRQTVNRWAKDHTPISERSVLLIRSKIRPKKK